MTDQSLPRRIAVVGSGIAALGAVHCFSADPTLHVDIFEAGTYAGGHTHTVYVENLDVCNTATGGSNGHHAKSKSNHAQATSTQQRTLVSDERISPTQSPVDTGFIVMNPLTYPNMLSLLAQLGISPTNSDMSFSVSRRDPQSPSKPTLEWAGKSLGTLFADWQNLWVGMGGIWRLAYDAWKFGEEAEQYVRKGEEEKFDEDGKFIGNKVESEGGNGNTKKELTIGAFFKSRSYSSFFYENYILPMTAAIWSTPAEEVFDGFPFETLVRFMRNHRLLELGERPQWLTVPLGSKTYADAILSRLPPTQHLHLSTPITSLRRIVTNNNKLQVFLTDATGKEWGGYDAVLMACHGDQALKILGNQATEEEKRVLGRVAFTKNRCVLHRDERLMPANKSCWSSWNYLSLAPSGSESKNGSMCLTYWMNNLQPFIPKAQGNIFVTVNPFIEPEGKLGEYEYEHPRLDGELVKSQDEIGEIQNKRGVVYAGAWTNYGFHEDGVTSSLLAAASLGYPPPFPIHINGGYPTHRTSYPSAPGVAEVKLAPPKYTRTYEREQNKKKKEHRGWFSASWAAAGVAGLGVWVYNGGNKTVEVWAGKVGEVVKRASEAVLGSK